MSGMSSRPLSESPIWIPQSEQLRALVGKCPLLCERDGREYVLQLGIIQAPPNGPDRGKIAVGFWQTNRSPVPFEAVQLGEQIPTKRCSGLSAYLDESAVNQIKEGSDYCDLFLRLTD
jgi:hypothetical protein